MAGRWKALLSAAQSSGIYFRLTKLSPVLPWENSGQHVPIWLGPSRVYPAERGHLRLLLKPAWVNRALEITCWKTAGGWGGLSWLEVVDLVWLHLTEDLC